MGKWIAQSWLILYNVEDTLGGVSNFYPLV